MAPDFRAGLQPPPLVQLRAPIDGSPYAMGGMAHVMWRLLSHGRQELPGAAAAGGSAADEYRSVCEFMRLYATLRFYQLALLLGTTGSIVTALTSQAVRESFARAEFLKAGGLLVSLAFLVMEFRATSHWHRLRERANALAAALRYQAFPVHTRWNPLTTSGAGFYLHAAVATLWCSSLFFRF
jgi:hypothetical protein